MQKFVGQSNGNRIEEEKEEISTLLLSAKHGKWNEVWRIIGTPEKPKKAYLLNCIPENRRWAVLHQAVYWKDPIIVRKLLSFDACDPSLKAKECRSEVGPTSGMTAKQIAREYGHADVEKVLSEQKNKFNEVDEEIDTFHPLHTDIERKGFGLIPIALAAYKNTFHPKMIDPRKSVSSVLREIFNDLNISESRWIEVRDKISDSIYVVCENSAQTVKECSFREGFYQQIINAYTEESTYLYTYLNTALRRQREYDYKPSAIDLAMGPYVVMYQMLLLFWDELSRDNTKTYRRMKLTEKDMEKYQVGVQFTWLAFVSSSVNPSKATPFPTYTGATGDNKVTFIIDNTANSSHQPRNIEHYAKFEENERVYPAGAKFEVTKRSRKGEAISVELKLLSS